MLEIHAPDRPAVNWTGPTPMMDLDDPRIRIRCLALTQLCRSEREKALAVYLFVKRLPFCKSIRWRHLTARQVLDRGCGDAEDKACLFVALARSAGLKARLVYRKLNGKFLRGLTRLLGTAGRPAVQVSIEGAWSTTDTFIFDAVYVAAAKTRMRELKWEFGFGIHRTANLLWTGRSDAYLTGGDLVDTLGVFHDPRGFADSQAYQDLYGGWGHRCRLDLASLCMGWSIARLRTWGASAPALT